MPNSNEHPIKTQKITNPLYLGKLGPRIQDFVKKINQPGIIYETLYGYFLNTIQNAYVNTQLNKDDSNEFWIAYLETHNEQEPIEPLAFAHWLVRGLPHVGKTTLDFIYNWSKKRKAVQALIEEWENFGLRHRCSFFNAYIINEKVYEHFEKIAIERGYEINKTGVIEFIARKRGGK